MTEITPALNLAFDDVLRRFAGRVSICGGQ